MGMTYFAHLPSLDTEPYTNYFLHTFMPNHDYDGNRKVAYIQYFRKDFYNDSTIMSLERILRENFKFPPIEYFIIFKHDKAQDIHHDGIKIPRYASLNLPLSNFESTKMIFYKASINTIIMNVNDANYYLPETAEPVVELEGSNEWVLVDSSIPHNITNVNFNNPRITVCLRFISNPTIDQLIKMAHKAGNKTLIANK
jgi:hypothetical protein